MARGGRRCASATSRHGPRSSRTAWHIWLSVHSCVRKYLRACPSRFWIGPCVCPRLRSRLCLCTRLCLCRRVSVWACACVQYGHLCNMATCAIWPPVQYGLLCNMAICAIWPPVQYGHPFAYSGVRSPRNGDMCRRAEHARHQEPGSTD